MKSFLLLVAILVVTCHSQKLAKDVCDAKRQYVDVGVTGADVIIGGIFDMRQPGFAGFSCGDPTPDMQLYEAARFAVNKINSDNHVPGITFGMKAYDTCSSPDMATKAALDFYPQYSSTEESCTDANKLKLGILGTFKSESSEAVAKLTGSFQVSMVSPRAATTDLSFKKMYPYFLRTDDSIARWIQAVLEVAKKLGWSRIIVAHTDNYYGMAGKDELVRYAHTSGICVTEVLAIKTSGSSSDFATALAKLRNSNTVGAVFFGDNFVAPKFISGIQSAAQVNSRIGDIQWIFRHIDSNNDFSSLSYTRGLIYIGPQPVAVNEFRDYWSNLNERVPDNENPWFQSWYIFTNKCKVPGFDVDLADCAIISANDKRAAFKQSTNVEEVIEAVYAYSEALKNAHRQLCGSRPGMCQQLNQMTTETFHNTYLKNVDFTFGPSQSIASLRNTRVKFDNNGDPVSFQYGIYNYNNKQSTPFSFKEVGSYKDGVLNFNTADAVAYDRTRTSALSSYPSSPCPGGKCGSCVSPALELSYSFNPGDIILGAFMDFHWPGPSALTCGDMWATGSQLGLAVKFAFNSLKTQFPSILNGVDLGSLILDVCMDGGLAKLYLSHLYSGRISKIGKLSDEAVDTSRLPLFLETSPPAAKSIAEIMSLAKTPIVDSTTTPSLFSSDELYSYFTRTLPADDKQARAISKLLLHMGWSYVQAVHDTSLYGRGGVKDFIKMAVSDSICVGKTHEIPATQSDSDFDNLIAKLLEKQEAAVVVVFAWEDNIQKIFQAVKRANAKGKLLFVACEAWGDTMALQGIEDVNEGTMAIQMKNYDIDGLQTFFRSQKPSDYQGISDSAWFENYYESVANCYINPLHSSKYRTPCSDLPLGSFSNWKTSQYVPYTVFSVYAAANAMHKTLVELCGSAYVGVCANFRSSSDVGEKLLKYLKDITFQYKLGSSITQEFRLRDGEGISDFKIINFRNDGSYQEVANYDNNLGALNTFTSSSVVYPNGVTSFKSSCSHLCRECSYLYSHKPALHMAGDIQLGALFPVHKSGSRGPFSCGDIKTSNGFQYVTALAYAVNSINDGSGPFDLPGIDLGALVLDYCQEPANAYGLTTALYSGVYNPIQMGMEMMAYPVSKIGAWITDSSSATAEVNEIVKKLNLPLISPSATKADLNANSEYPTFFRTLPGDDVVSLGISKICKALGFKFVQVIYSDTEYGRGGLSTFTALARQDGICVSYSYKFGVDGTADEIITAALKRGTDVIVMFTGTSDTDAFMKANNNRAFNERKLKIILPHPYSSVMAQYPTAAKDTISLRIQSPQLAGYINYLKSLSLDDYMKNPYFKEYYQAYFKCDLTGEFKYGVRCTNSLSFPDNNFVQENFVLTTINAVYAYAGAVDAVLTEICGRDYNSMCEDAKKSTDLYDKILNKLDTTTFNDPTNRRFQFVNREATVVFDVLRHSGSAYVLEGSFAGASMIWNDLNTLQKNYEAIETTCESPCQMCLEKSIDFTYIPGDILLGGLFDVHVRGVNPFTCGNVNTLHGFQLLEAFQFALKKVNSKNGMFKDILPNVRLGGIGIDTCESAVRTGYMVSNIFNGRTVLNKDGSVISQDDIVSYIGGYASDRSMYVARILKTLGISQVSYKSSSIDLLDRDRYPYFLSTVPSDDKLALALVKILDKFDIRYVQVLHSDNKYGISGAKMFSEAASKAKICIAQTSFFHDNGTVTIESAKSGVTSILKKPNANVVVLFANTEHVEEFLKAVGKDEKARNKFIFVGTDTWANQHDILEKVDYKDGNVALGSLTINTEYEDLTEFDAYIGSKTTANYPENPWFTDYYEELQNCYLTTVNIRYPRQCSRIPTSVIKSRRYRQDPGIVNVINAVYASAFGIHSALKEVCGSDYTTVCESFVNYEKKGELIKRHTQEAKFMDMSGRQFAFSDRGDGEKGFFYYQVKETIVNDFEYSKIGSITSEGNVTAVAKLPVQWDGSCDRPDVCTECPSIRDRITRYMIGKSNHEDPLSIVGVFNVHKQGDDDYLCGPLSTEGGFLQAMAFFYAIERAENLPFGLRGLVLDTCTKDLRVDQDIYGLLSGNGLCNSDFDVDGIKMSNIGAFLTQFTTNTYAAGRVLPPLKISFLSSSATSDVFSNQRRYNYFARTVPPDALQMKLIADILKDLGWDYFSLVHDSSVYGISGAGNIKSYLKSRKLCSSTTIQLPVDLTPGIAEATVTQLDKIEQANVVVMIGYQNTIAEMLKAVKKLGKQQRFLWIGTDTWGNNPLVVSDIIGEPIDAITLTIRSTEVTGFQKYLKDTVRFSQTDLSRPASIPRDWFEEFFQKTFKCRLPGGTKPLDFETECTLDEDTSKAKDSTFLQDNYILQTIAATDAITGAIRKFRTDFCPDALSLEECFKVASTRTERNPRDILFELILATQKDLTDFYTLNENFFLNFTSDRYWDVGYDIYRFDGSKYNKISRDDLKALGKSLRNSTCTESYLCPNCDEYSDGVAAPVYDAQMGKIYGGPRNFFHYKSIWREAQEKYDYEKDLKWPVWAVVVAILTCIGLLIGIIVFLFLLISYPTLGGTSILGFMVMLGILGIYAINFAFFLPAAMATCTARRLVMGITYAIVFGALLVKAIDNWRFSDVEYTVRRYKGVTNPCSLFFVALGIVLIEAIIPIEWLILVHPTASRLNDDTTHDYMWCDPFNKYDEGLALSFIFIIFLVLLTAAFAGLAWESENNYYESRWILVSAISTAGCFLVWMVVTTNAGPIYRDPAVAIGNLVNATALLIFMPIRKMVLLISVRIEQKKGKMNVEDVYQPDSNELYSTAYTNSAYDGDVAGHKLSSSKDSLSGRM